MRKLLLITLLVACSTEQKQTISEQAMEDPERRKELLEATLRVLDRHPEYTDEMFQLALKHETFDRLLVNTASAVKDDKVAARVAKHLVGNPSGLTRVFVQTLDAAQDKPAAQAAIAEAMEQRADLAAAVLIQHPKQLATVSKALVAVAKENPETAGQLKEVVKNL
jgi:hypothetical protein